MAGDPFDLQRFVAAQDPVWETVLAELRAGRKQTHWMWFVFPQLAGLGRSSMARHYGLSGLDEARAYRAHPVLGPRLREACALLLDAPEGRQAGEILGGIDAVKLRSCLTLFARAAPGDEVFGRCLQRYFGGQADPLTIAELG
ncbi:DUF1810 domain-containing protein [Ramlibacter sp.]|uniref:DUF1810 domain-containing protein n=1 Tax=Ramlibacter sp. TaxID=1917967 RepID=UPI002FC5A678